MISGCSPENSSRKSQNGSTMQNGLTVQNQNYLHNLNPTHVYIDQELPTHVYIDQELPDNITRVCNFRARVFTIRLYIRCDNNRNKPVGGWAAYWEAKNITLFGNENRDEDEEKIIPNSTIPNFITTGSVEGLDTIGSVEGLELIEAVSAGPITLNP